MFLRRSPSIILLIILSWVCLSVYSDDLAEMGRKVFQQFSSSVITVKANLLIVTSDGEEETVGQCTAVLITPAGVAVLALSALDPSILLDQEMRNTINIRIASIKMIFKEEKEITAEVLLQDKERDIMIIRAKEPIPEDVTKINLTKENISIPQVLDPLLLIMQHGKVARRTHSGTILRVESVVEKPFLFYTLSQSRNFEVLSSPLFSMDGKFVGIGTLRVVQEWKDETENNSLIIVLPAEQLIPLISEALNQKPPQEPTASPNPKTETTSP